MVCSCMCVQEWSIFWAVGGGDQKIEMKKPCISPLYHAKVGFIDKKTEFGREMLVA